MGATTTTAPCPASVTQSLKACWSHLPRLRMVSRLHSRTRLAGAVAATSMTPMFMRRGEDMVPVEGSLVTRRSTLACTSNGGRRAPLGSTCKVCLRWEPGLVVPERKGG